jgi:hypothetical protein
MPGMETVLAARGISTLEVERTTVAEACSETTLADLISMLTTEPPGVENSPLILFPALQAQFPGSIKKK